MSENIEKIKDRIAKLLRMAQDAGSPNEAAIAAQRARSLMDKYQLSESDVNGEINESFGEGDAVANGRRKHYTNIPFYMNVVSVSVAKFNDCNAVIRRIYATEGPHKGIRKVIRIVGFESDVNLAVSMFQSLIAMIDAACKKWMIENGYTGRYNREVGEQFKGACARELVARLNEITLARDENANVEAEEQIGTGLMVIAKKKRVEEHFGEAKYTKTNQTEVRNNGMHKARIAGMREGRTMEFQKKVD